MTIENGCTVNEAASAAKLAQKLLLEHKLSIADIEEQSEISEFLLDDFNERAITWRSYLATVVCEANSTACFVSNSWHNGAKKCSLRIVGKPNDVEIAKYFYLHLSSEIERLCKFYMASGAGTGKTWSNSFKLGAAKAIADKLAEAKKEVIITASSSAIVRLDGELAVVKDWLTQKVKLKKGKPSHFTCDNSAYSSGYKAGKNISLNKAIEETNG